MEAEAAKLKQMQEAVEQQLSTGTVCNVKLDLASKSIMGLINGFLIA